MKIQVVEFCHANQIPFMEGAVIKYMCRWRSKGGVVDLEKAKHFIEMMIAMEREPYAKDRMSGVRTQIHKDQARTLPPEASSFRERPRNS